MCAGGTRCRNLNGGGGFGTGTARVDGARGYLNVWVSWVLLPTGYDRDVIGFEWIPRLNISFGLERSFTDVAVPAEKQPADRPADSEPPPGVPTYRGPARPDYWEWPVFPGEHCYEVLSARICAVSECDYNEVIKVLNEKAVHPKQVEPFDPDSDVIYEADVDLPIPYSGKDSVRVEPIRADNGLQIGVLNTALGDHALRPGTVSRTGVAHEGFYRIHTVGKGGGWWPRQNVVRKEQVWGELDQLVIDEF